MCRSLALLIGCAVADFCFNLDNGGLVRFLRCRNRCLNCVNIIAVRNLLCVPAVSLKAFQHILGKCGCCIALNRNVVAVIQYYNLVQTHCPCQRSRLGGNALLQAAITAECVCVMVYHLKFGCVEFCSQMAFRQCHTNRIGNALSQRACCHLNPCCMLIFGVAGCQGISLTEVFQILNRQPIAKHMQQGIQQCRAVSCGKNKSVSVIPVGVCRVCFQLLCPQGICRRCRAKGQTGMTAFCLLDSLCRQKTQGVNCQVVHIIHLVFLQRLQFFFAVSKLSYFLGTDSQSFRNLSIPISVRGCFAI